MSCSSNDEHIGMSALARSVGIISLTFTFNKHLGFSTHASGWHAQAVEI